MPYWGNQSRYNKESALTIIGTVPTVVGETAYDLHDLNPKAFKFRNNGQGTLVAGVLEYSTDNVTWGTHAEIGAGVLGSATDDVTIIVDTMWRFWRARVAVASGSQGTGQCWWNF